MLENVESPVAGGKRVKRAWTKKRIKMGEYHRLSTVYTLEGLTDLQRRVITKLTVVFQGLI